MAKLTAKTRNALPAKDFAGPDRSYPIENRAHAADAEARASGKPIAARVDAKVHAEYPDMGNAGKSSHEGHATEHGSRDSVHAAIAHHFGG